MKLSVCLFMSVMYRNDWAKPNAARQVPCFILPENGAPIFPELRRRLTINIQSPYWMPCKFCRKIWDKFVVKKPGSRAKPPSKVSWSHFLGVEVNYPWCWDNLVSQSWSLLLCCAGQYHSALCSCVISAGCCSSGEKVIFEIINFFKKIQNIFGLKYSNLFYDLRKEKIKLWQKIIITGDD